MKLRLKTITSTQSKNRQTEKQSKNSNDYEISKKNKRIESNRNIRKIAFVYKKQRNPNIKAMSIRINEYMSIRDCQVYEYYVVNYIKVLRKLVLSFLSVLSSRNAESI